MKKQYSSLVLTGSIAFDEIMDFPGKFVDHFHPEQLHQINVSFVVNRLDKQIGGIATNIAYNAAIISKKMISVLSGIGRDGEEIMKFFAARKIDTTGIIKDSETFTATGKVITDMTNNQIWGFYYGALEKTGALDLRKTIRDKHPNPLLLISPTHANGFLSIQKQAIEYGVPYVYDPGMALTWIKDDDLKKGVMGCTYLIANDYEIAQIYRRLGMTASQLVQKGIGLITTLGEKGSHYEDSYFHFKIPAYKVKKVVDPTGAGDAFRGGCFAGLIEGRNIEESMRIGSALASFSVEHYGTINHAPSIKEVMDRVRSLS